MTALIFDTCCGCIELRTGCLIIGYLNLIYSIITVIATLVVGLAVGVAVSSDEFQAELHKHGEFSSGATAALSITLIVLVVIILLFFIFNIVFLVGVHQNKRGHVKAYLIFNLIFLILFAIMFFAGFANTPINWGSVIQNLIVLLLSTYFLLVIRSFYYKLDDTSRQPAIYNTA